MKGSARSKSTCCPPQKTVSVPSTAPFSPPVTGASMSECPSVLSFSPRRIAAEGSIVEWSTKSVPAFALGAMGAAGATAGARSPEMSSISPDGQNKYAPVPKSPEPTSTRTIKRNQNTQSPLVQRLRAHGALAITPTSRPSVCQAHARRQGDPARARPQTRSCPRLTSGARKRRGWRRWSSRPLPSAHRHGLAGCARRR